MVFLSRFLCSNKTKRYVTVNVKNISTKQLQYTWHAVNVWRSARADVRAGPLLPLCISLLSDCLSLSLSYCLPPLFLSLSTAFSSLLIPRINNSRRVPLHFPLNMLGHKSPLCVSRQEGCLS